MARILLAAAIATTLAGCGTFALPSVSKLGLSPQVVAGWQIVPVTPVDSHAVDPSLIERKAGGYVIAYATDRLGDKHVYLTTSPDGAHWSAPVAIARSTLTDESPALWEDATGQLHVFFASNRTNRFALYEATSTDATTWSDAQALPEDTDEAYHPSVTPMASGSLALAYETLGGTLRFRTRTPSGSWADATTLYQGGADPTLASNPDGSLTLGFKSYQRLYLRTRSAAGSWTTPLSVPLEAPAETPSLASDGHGGLWLFYAVQAGESWKVAERRNDGHGWGAAMDVAAGETDNEHPAALVTHAGERVMAWAVSSDLRGSGLFFARHR